MTDGSQWPNDDLIADLVYRTTREYAELIMHEAKDPDADLSGFPGSPTELDTRLWVDATEFLVLSPPRIWDAFHSFADVGGERHDAEVDEHIGRLTLALAEWDGKAAEAFSVHVGHIGSFVVAQKRYLDELLRSYAAAYKLAVQARESFKSLVEEWIEVSRQYREDDDERRRAVRIKVGAGILGAVLGAATGGTALAAGLGAGSALTGAAAEEITADLGGTNGVDVWRSYEDAYRRLAQSNEAEMETIKKFVNDTHDQIAKETAEVLLYRRLPPETDVDSPNFRYEEFSYDGYAGGYGHAVEVERRKFVDEKNASGFRADGAIALRLDGAAATESRVGDV